MQTAQTPPASKIAGYRLSPQQQRLWRLQQRRPPFRAVLQLRSHKPYAADQLQAALQQLIDRHEILRTTFPTLPGMTMPLQVIADSLSSESVLVRYSTAPQVQNLLKQPFDWVQGPLFQVHWIRPDELLFSVSALCADGATLSLLAQEFQQFYGATPQLEDPLQYADLAEWQIELLEGEDTAAGRSYWRRSSNLEQVVQRLPLERPKDSVESDTFQFETHSVELPIEQAQSLYSWAAQQGVTVDEVCLAVWQILIARLTEQSTLTLGYSCNARQHYEELQTACGLLTRDLPLRAELQPDQSFAALVAQVHQTLADIQPWQDYFAWEQDETGWFPISFGVEAAPANLSPLEVTATSTLLEPSTLKLVCRPQADNLSGDLTLDWLYDASRLDLSTIQQIQGYWQTLMTEALAAPETTLAQLPLLGAAERQTLLVDFNQATTQPSNYNSLHQWFEAQVACTPEHAALRFEADCLTYRQLNNRANQIAQRLRQQGVTSESVVAVVLPRCLDWVIAILGILKAGGAYLPLDPHLPTERLQTICQDAAVVQVLTQVEWCDRIPKTIPTHCLDAISNETNTENLPHHTAPEHLAYVIYTSGSTGQPKGVAVEHRNILNYVQGILPQLDLKANAHYGLVSSVAADLGNTVLFAALCTGGCLHLIAEDRTLQASALADYCRQHPLDCLKIVPSHLGALLTDESDTTWLPHWCLVLGGEAAPGSLVKEIRRHRPAGKILNHYGPSETTVGVLTYPVPEALQETTLPLGQPLPNVQVYVLDAHHQPVPVGIPGEIYVGGAAVSRGYLNRPALTTERFIANPFDSGRLYRTGDRGRHLPSGQIEFLGRIDDQIKLRGFRIELGEIAAVLQQHPAVQQAIVVLREESPEPARLVAYAITTASPEDLKTDLATKLPDYMVPAVVVPLRAFPLNANGKIDRQALPAPSRRSDVEQTAASTAAEQTLVGIWQDLLRVDNIGIHDNFFELGGDSILSIQVIARANQAGLQLTPRQLFEHQTIAGLAAVAGTATAAKAEQGPISGVAPLTPIQHRFFEQAVNNRNHWNQALLLEVRESLNPDLLEQAFNHLIQHHDALRLRFQRQDNRWQAVHGDHRPLSLRRIDAPGCADVETQIVTHANALQTSLNITDGPLMGAAWFDFGPTCSARLLVVVHHLVIDGVSWRVLLEDLQTVYGQLQSGVAIALPPKTTSFQQWGKHLVNYSQSLPQTQPSQNPAPLPLDFADGNNTVASAHTLALSLDVAETQALLREVPKAYQSQINDVLLTALLQGMTKWTERSSLMIELENHGRDDFDGQLDLSRTVGWFTAIFPVQLTLPADPNPGAALMAIKEQLRRPGRPLDYGVGRYLSGEETTHPEPSLIFNYLGQFDSSLPEASLFGLAPESEGRSRDPKTRRRHLLEINGRVLAGQLQLAWTYSDQCHRQETIAQVAEQTMAALRALIAHCTSNEAGGYTPSDFPQANLSQTALEQVLAQLQTSEEG
ncbi:amino acid adenylation domain-containing protein [Leptolyngbya cf. ectocarpi LEGE 11479]|uniref:Amino acid adenylation domain-containing protein n=1 Tax=Leptolyngbya cf. ectocarpi LEGE 11479 TaxID=1828722 RepID=A0A928ZVR8_LEPEC|nr:non-ribosomal peptide synthetase [Leptolyngbya ectocarpi]MBE9068367.1 amino acid adenylation domain-containing protein [Leptolyngbya cf. ectocarpi LEGE 11479]